MNEFSVDILSMATYNAETKVWSNPADPPLYNPSANLGQVLLSALELSQDVTSQLDSTTGRKVTASEIRLRAIRIAQNLRKQGITESDILAISAYNLEIVPSILLAALLLGAPINTLDPDFTTGTTFVHI